MWFNRGAPLRYRLGTTPSGSDGLSTWRARWPRASNRPWLSVFEGCRRRVAFVRGEGKERLLQAAAAGAELGQQDPATGQPGGELGDGLGRRFDVQDQGAVV